MELGHKALYLSSLQNNMAFCLPPLLAPIHCVYTLCIVALYRSLIHTFGDWSGLGIHAQIQFPMPDELAWVRQYEQRGP